MYLRPRKNAMRYRLRVLTLMCAMLPCAAFWPSGPSLASPQNAQPGGQPDIRTRTNAHRGNNFDACSLLTGKEITDLLGEPLDALNSTRRASTRKRDGRLRVKLPSNPHSVPHPEHGQRKLNLKVRRKLRPESRGLLRLLAKKHIGSEVRSRERSTFCRENSS